ncbi:MerR family transcriptional regulator [Deinococcus multiflagellatus]|uniref:MerR family transcriptional regulator n=1 Tax=Deinococcus multiflagellatus TaxID=1656887 RepID=A0ABW1ZMM2_9DEIO|nr:MerR family transcriptional regulator [Deinococcus multiflagellatus]MBZ9712338.1 MerR family transcriptional regulator [Deinococcus multiflagellatus]
MPTPALPLMTIGAFAGASRLSPKALRLYDELGLLRPAQVDPQSGYRRYTPAQLADARLIGRLRQADMPLPAIGALLALPAGERPAALRLHLAALDAEHRQRRDLTRHLIQHLEGETPMSLPTPQTRTVPAQNVATLTRQVYVDGLSAAISQGMTTLLQTLRDQGAQPAAAPFVIYHGEVNADSDGPIEICVPYSGALHPAGEVGLRVEPAHAEAFVTLTKDQFEFPAILAAYDVTCAAAQAQGTCGDLSPREVYPHDWDAAGAGDPAGEVAWPYHPHP